MIWAIRESRKISAGGKSQRAIFLSPLGIYTRYTLAAYLRFTGLIAIGCLVAALTIDLSPQLPRIWNSQGGYPNAVARVLWYLALRSADVITRLISIVCFLGVFAAEIASTWSRERQVIWNTGRSPMQCLIPALLLGLLAGLLQFGFDRYLRPAAIAAQISDRLGEYGERYDRRPLPYRTWIVAGDDLVHARIEFGPPAALHDVTIYKFATEQHRLEAVITAQTARAPADGLTWKLEQGRRWEISTRQTSPDRDAVVDTVALQLDPLWVSNFGINAMFLPQPVLDALAQGTGVFDRRAYQTWIQIRYSSLVAPSAMALLASSLSLLLLATSITPQAVLGIALAGYAGHVLTRAFSLLGIYGYLPPVVVGWITPALQLASAVLLLVAASWWRSRPTGNVNKR